jgi:hypothetical protein
MVGESGIKPETSRFSLRTPCALSLSYSPINYGIVCIISRYAQLLQTFLLFFARQSEQYKLAAASRQEAFIYFLGRHT